MAVKWTPSLWPEDRKLLTWDTSCTCLLLSSLCWNSKHCQLHCHCVMKGQKMWSTLLCVCVYPSHCCHNLTDWCTDSIDSLLHLHSSEMTQAQRAELTAFSVCIHTIRERFLRHTLKGITYSFCDVGLLAILLIKWWAHRCDSITSSYIMRWPYLHFMVNQRTILTNSFFELKFIRDAQIRNLRADDDKQQSSVCCVVCIPHMYIINVTDHYLVFFGSIYSVHD